MSESTSFDGVVCFGGEDWWYHNRGHFDMRMMHELSRHHEVLYVNSIGMRFPRLGEGGMFLRRIARKWKSIRRGVVRVRDRFSVYSPLTIPGRVGRPFSRPALRLQTRWITRRMGLRRPLVWVNQPTSWDVVEQMPRAALVYQRTDRYEDFPDVDREQIIAFDHALKAAADLTVFCSTPLFEDEKADCRRAIFVDHGVDFEAFERGAVEAPPADLAAVPRPRVGFVGGVDKQTFDPELFGEVVARLPEYQFVIVGGCTLDPDWLNAPNVHALGQKDYDEVWRYPGGCDVLVMPWNKSHWIQACNPVKLKEYLAAGRPVVSTWFDELRNYEGYVRVATEAPAFADAIREELDRDTPEEADRRRDRVRAESWTSRAERVVAALGEPEGAGR